MIQFRNRAIGLLILVIGLVPVYSQLSPGKLSESHAHLEGMSNCTKCHTLGEKVSNEKCLDCHREIDSRIRQGRGYHASTEVLGNECVKCHSDHHGRNFQMIHFDTDKFDHSLAGYELQGSHAGKACADCHKPEFIKEPEIRKKKSTYMGLDRSCLTCHSDYHQGTLSRDCASCHDQQVFKPASKFDHRNARFKLRGKHSSVDCRKCHTVSVTNGVKMQQFSGVRFENCTSCHSDVHNNKFGQNCVSCHSEESFQRIKQMKNFNHSLTNYPLEGKHEFVSCSKCHKSAYTAAIKYQSCNNCHNDFHESQFSRKGKSPDCSSCHSTRGFDRSDFTIERHKESPFPLSGAHLATPCFACHKKSGKWSFREIGMKCADCHSDIHEAYLDRKYYGEASCESCHADRRWGEIAFDHSKTGYALEGAHIRQSCRSCHFREGEDGMVEQKFTGLSHSCLHCHTDVHRGEFEEAGGSVCLTCHDYNSWLASRFDHSQTAFPLDGKHVNVACSECHIPVATAELTYVQFNIEDFSCEACH